MNWIRTSFSKDKDSGNGAGVRLKTTQITSKSNKTASVSSNSNKTPLQRAKERAGVPTAITTKQQSNVNIDGQYGIPSLIALNSAEQNTRALQRRNSANSTNSRRSQRPRADSEPDISETILAMAGGAGGLNSAEQNTRPLRRRNSANTNRSGRVTRPRSDSEPDLSETILAMAGGTGEGVTNNNTNAVASRGQRSKSTVVRGGAQIGPRRKSERSELEGGMTTSRSCPDMLDDLIQDVNEPAPWRQMQQKRQQTLRGAPQLSSSHVGERISVPVRAERRLSDLTLPKGLDEPAPWRKKQQPNSSRRSTQFSSMQKRMKSMRKPPPQLAPASSGRAPIVGERVFVPLNDGQSSSGGVPRCNTPSSSPPTSVSTDVSKSSRRGSGSSVDSLNSLSAMSGIGLSALSAPLAETRGIRDDVVITSSSHKRRPPSLPSSPPTHSGLKTEDKPSSCNGISKDTDHVLQVRALNDSLRELGFGKDEIRRHSDIYRRQSDNINAQQYISAMLEAEHPRRSRTKPRQQQPRNSRITKTSHFRSKSQQEELRAEWPTKQHDGPVRYPHDAVAPRKAKGGSNDGRPSFRSLPGVLLDPDEDMEQKPPASAQQGQGEQMERRHSSSSLNMLMGTCKPFGLYNNNRPLSNKSKKNPKRRRNVKFADKLQVHCYEAPPSKDTKKLFYSRDEDNAFSDLTIAHARSIRGYIKSSIKNDSTFNSLTGLPSPEVLQRHLLSPEDIIGIEHLLCGRGVARASLNLKVNQLKLLLDEQRRGTDVEELACKMQKYSNISEKLAVCRASYAAMF